MIKGFFGIEARNCTSYRSELLSGAGFQLFRSELRFLVVGESCKVGLIHHKDSFSNFKTEKSTGIIISYAYLSSFSRAAASVTGAWQV